MFEKLTSARIARQIVALAFICMFTFSSVFAQGVKQKVRFARGTSLATIHGAVVRGDRDRYYLAAKKARR